MPNLFLFDSFTLVCAAIFAALSLATLACAPRRDRGAGGIATLVFISFGTLLAYCSATLPLFCLGWILTTLPYWTRWAPGGPRLALGVSTLALIAGSVLSLVNPEAAPMTTFGLFVVATLIRKGIFPFHSWVLLGFERSPVLPLGLLLNGHLGAFLLIRFAIPMFPESARLALPLLGVLALMSSLYTAVLALSQKSPVIILALLNVSQAAFILAGLQSRNEVGVAGAMIHWSVVAVATTGLWLVYRSIEARYAGVARDAGDLGLVTHIPRLAAFFAVCGLALIGLPGTLGFAAEDLLFHGSLESHRLLGVTLPLATALNGITMYRLFSRLFLGRAAKATPAIPDALPRERWALGAALLFLLWFGIAPSTLVKARAEAAGRIATLLEVR